MLSLISINPKPFGIPGIIFKLIRTVNHLLVSKIHKLSIAIASQISYLVFGYKRAAGGVDTSAF